MVMNYCGGNLLCRHSKVNRAVAGATVSIPFFAWLRASCPPRYVHKRLKKHYCGGNPVHDGVFRLFLVGLAGLVLVGCSTVATTQEDVEVTIQRKQAVDFARQGDESLVSRNFTQAETYYNQSLEANWATDNLEGVIQAHFSLGLLYLGLGYADRADQEYADALETAGILGNAVMLADCKLNQAKVLLYRDQAAEALAVLDGAMVSIANDKDEVRKAGFLHNRGAALKVLGRLDEAKKALNEALAINLKLKALKEPAANLYLLAAIANKEEKSAEALKYLDQALVLDKKSENSEGIAKDLYAQSVILRKLNGPDGKPRLNEAWNTLRRSFRVSLATNDEAATLRDLDQLIEMADTLGLPDQKASYQGMLTKYQTAKAAADQAVADKATADKAASEASAKAAAK